jgi:hypothetical protein
MDTNLIKKNKEIEERIDSALNELNTLMADMSKSSTFETDEDEKAVVFLYIINILDIDQRNLIYIDEFLKKRFGFPVLKAQFYMCEFIDHHKEIRERYTRVVQPVQVVVKKKGPKPYSEMTPEEVAVAKAKRAAKATVAPVIVPPVKKILKTKSNDSSMKSPGLLIWNSFVSLTRNELEKAGSPSSYDDSVKKAQELKNNDPDGYKLFSDNWTPA